MYNKDKDSLVYKAYNTMKHITNYRKCWYTQVSNLCTKWNCLTLLDIVENDSMSIGSKIRKINVELSRIEQE